MSLNNTTRVNLYDCIGSVCSLRAMFVNKVDEKQREGVISSGETQESSERSNETHRGLTCNRAGNNETPRGLTCNRAGNNETCRNLLLLSCS